MMVMNALVILILISLIIVFLVFYFQTDNRLRTIALKVDQLQPKILLRSSNVIRQERADHQDSLLLLEAKFNQAPRNTMLEDEMELVEKARDAIKSNNEELKRNGEWIGIPFDYEWHEYFARLPTLKSHYTRAVDKLQRSSAEH